MTDQELNKALALAIGYLPEHVKTYRGASIEVYRPKDEFELYDSVLWGMQEFDYRDPAVILPIVINYKLSLCFESESELWDVFAAGGDYLGDGASYHKTAALAVIELKNRGVM